MRHITGNDEIDELLTELAFEYHSWQAASRADLKHLGTCDNDMSFYDFLLTRGFSRFSLSAHGIGRDIQA